MAIPAGYLGVMSPNPSTAMLVQRTVAATESFVPPAGGAPPPPPPVVAVTGVTAGIPGTVAPTGFTKFTSLAALRGDATIGDVAKAGDAAWTTGQYVVITSTATAGGKASWDGATWQNGAAA